MSKRKPKVTKKEARATQTPQQTEGPVAEFKRIAAGLRASEEKAALRVLSRHRSVESLVTVAQEAMAEAKIVQEPGSEPRRRLGLANSQSDVACVEGCSHCCHLSVSTDIPQIVALARAIRQKPKAIVEGIVERLRASWPIISTLPLFERSKRRIACGVLDPESGACLAHEDRPTACRAWNSIDATDCERGLSDPNVTITHDGVDREFVIAIGRGLSDGLTKVGLDADQYVLDGALLIALELGDEAFQKWLAGENVFASAKWSAANLRTQARQSLGSTTPSEHS